MRALKNDCHSSTEGMLNNCKNDDIATNVEITQELVLTESFILSHFALPYTE